VKLTGREHVLRFARQLRMQWAGISAHVLPHCVCKLLSLLLLIFTVRSFMFSWRSVLTWRPSTCDAVWFGS